MGRGGRLLCRVLCRAGLEGETGVEGNQGKDLGLGMWLRGERLPSPIWALGSISSVMKSKAQNSKGRLEILRPTLREGGRRDRG